MPFDAAAITAKLERSGAVIVGLRSQAALLEAACTTVRACLRNGGRLYACGNGGSAAQAMHLTEEIVGRYKANRGPYPALCLNADPTALTCIANDYGFDRVFSRQVEAFAGEGDVLVVLSTSGNSPNILGALEAARARKVTTIGLLGKGGGPAAVLCDLALIVGASETEHIQEAHQVIIHLMLEAVEGV